MTPEKPKRLGVTLAEAGSPGGAHVAVASRHARRIFFCRFDDRGEREIERVPLPHRQDDVHFGFVPDVRVGTRYGLRAEGSWQPEAALRFDSAKLLVDPWAISIDGPFAFHPGLCERGRDTSGFVPKAIVSAPLPRIERATPRAPRWIYELPVKAFTMRHPGVPLHRRGTVAALAEPAVLAHLKHLGVDTIELMPLMAWIDERHLQALNLSNAWGYNPVTFMAPEPRLAPGGFAEIAATVKTLHDNGLQVLLDVVLNHSGESDAAGPTLSFRGLDNASYYRHIHGAPVNDTGCGNTLALDDPMVIDYVVAALRHWVDHTGIDGFRFDLATVMGRLPDGFSAAAPLIRAIENDPVLARSILIAEPWDVGPGGYQLGRFPEAWLEWNDRFRDDVRRFWRGDAFSANGLATRLAGSSDIFASSKRPASSVNFVAAHDGFTLRDLTLYETKDNIANGEGNRDGKPDEVTLKGGEVRALLAVLFFSRGTPMLTAGDEFGRSQRGNNNAYAQDNEITWLDWEGADRPLIAQVAELVRLRAAHPLLHQNRFLLGQPQGAAAVPDARWFDETGGEPDWSLPHLRLLGLSLGGKDRHLAIVVNGTPQPRAIKIPGGPWTRIYCSAAGDAVPPHSVSLYLSNQV